MTHDEAETILTETYAECVPTTLTALEIMALMVARLERRGMPRPQAVALVRKFMTT